MKTKAKRHSVFKHWLLVAAIVSGIITGICLPHLTIWSFPESLPKSVSLSVERPVPAIRQLTEKEASLLLQKLVQSHPRREIREDLDSLLASNKVGTNYEAPHLVKGMSGMAAVLTLNDKERGLVHVLSLDPLALQNPRRSVCYKQAVIFHEYWHLRQLFENRIPPRVFSLEGVGPTWTQADIEDFMESETEGYIREALFGREFGCLSELPPPSQEYFKGGVVALRQSLADIYGQMPATAPYKDILQGLVHKPPRFHVEEGD